VRAIAARATADAACDAATRTPPAARHGVAVETVGHRVFLHGGWRLDAGGRGAALDEFCVLDLEGEDEREERETIEFHERLERNPVRTALKR